MFGCTTQVLGWRNIHSANFQCAGFTTVESAVVPLKTARTSKQYDPRRQYPQWFHTNPEAAAGGRFGGLISSGWHTGGMAIRLVADAACNAPNRSPRQG